MIGRTLSHYEITAKLGEGGMGEVYRAEDTKLGRAVAIKVLPEAVAGDPERLARFEREAKMLAALNHSHIASIFSLESATLVKGGSPDTDLAPSDQGKATLGEHPDGPPEQPVSFLVLELAEGEDLEERIARGPILAADALPIALQIAEALEAAHERGIVHRDLKPANVKVDSDGQVKVLDFGLAKAIQGGPESAGPAGTDPDPSPQALALSPTLTAQMTQPGVLLGTAAYMSPEQARGKEADSRSDVWAFGLILMEMLTGQQTFPGETVSDVLAAVLRQEIDWDQLPDDVPPSARRVLRLCLERDPRQRLRNLGDARLLLAMADEHQTQPDAPPATTLLGLPPTRSLWATIAAVLLIGAVLGALAISLLRPAAQTTSDSAAAEPPTFRMLTFQETVLTGARFTADGESVVYSTRESPTRQRLFLSRLDSPGSLPLAIEGARLQDVSSHGELALELDGSVLARAPITGGAPREMANGVSSADFSADGAELAVVRQEGGRMWIEFPMGQPVIDNASNLKSVRIDPGGQHVAWLELVGGRWEVRIAERGGEARTLVGSWESADGLAWHPSGREIWFTAGGEINFEVHAVDLGGSLRLITRLPARLTLHDIDAEGRVLLSMWRYRSRAFLRDMNSGRETEVTWLDSTQPVGLSADGEWILLAEFGQGADEDRTVYLRKGPTTVPVKLGGGIATSLSPDLHWVATTTMSAPERIVLLPTGAGEPRRPQTPTIENFEAVYFLPGSDRLLFQGNAPGEPRSISLLDLATETVQQISPDGTVFTGQNPISPDGQEYVAQRIGEPPMIWPVEPAGQAEPRAIPGLDDGTYPMGWTADGRGLHVARQETSNRVSIGRIDLETGAFERSGDSFVKPDTPGSFWTGAIASPDGRWVLYGSGVTRSELYVVDGLR